MFATDFLFDNQRASDLGLMICSFNGDIETASGGEIEYNAIKTPGSDTFSIYGSQLNSVIVWNFSICKIPHANTSPYFDPYEESQVVKWLLNMKGYKTLQFNQPEYEDIFYQAYFNITPHQVAGQTIGFDLVATSNCAYGFSDIIKRKSILNSSAPLRLHIRSDVNTYILPKVKIKGTGNFKINNYSDENLQHSILTKALEFQNITKEIMMDSEMDIITGLSSPSDFNWHFLRLIDGKNIITTGSESNIEIEIQYREPRYIRI